MDHLNVKIFKNKKFSDILEEIYNNQNKTKSKVDVLIGELKNLINDIGDATLVVPLIKEYLDIGVKNDDQLIKMAQIIQRVIQYQSQNDTSSSDSLLTDKEREELLEIANQLEDSNKQLPEANKED